MAWTRALLFSLPLAALGVGGWSAWRVSQSTREQDRDLVMLLPGALPALNPFLPANEAERQLLDLIHEPLIRLDREGRLGTALAEQWGWHQNMTCWFASPEAAKAAATAVNDQPVEKRASWDLESVTQDRSSLVLRFSHPGSTVADEVLAVLSTQQPQHLAFLRIASGPETRAAIQAYAAHADHAPSTKRLWFDDDGTCELVTTRTGLQAQQSLMDWLRTRQPILPEITPMAEVTALLEPVLEFRLKADARWADGTAITAADVKATLDDVLPRPWPLPGRDAFRHIQNITAPEPGVVQVIYRKRHSPALPAWAALPILPAAWLKKTHDSFATTPPPGAGLWQITHRDNRRLWLEKRNTEPREKLQVLAATSPIQARVGLATGAFDILWPAPEDRTTLGKAADLRLVPTPPHNQLMLVWQTEAPQLRELRVRIALSLALDRRALSREMPGGTARLHDSFFPPGRWFSKGQTTLRQDLRAAEQQLAEAGWLRDVSGQLKKGGAVFELRIVIPAGNADRQRLAEALAASWKKLGISVEIIGSPPDRYVADLRGGRFDVALLGGELEPGWDVLPLWHSSHTDGRGLNLSRIADAQLDLLLEALMGEFDPAQIPRRTAAIESRLATLRPALPLFTDVAEMAVRLTRFPGLPELDTERGITLRELLPATQRQSRPTVKFEMLAPKASEPPAPVPPKKPAKLEMLAPD